MAKLLEERGLRADVEDVLHAEDVDGEEVDGLLLLVLLLDLHRLRLLLLLLFLVLLLLLLAFLLRGSGLLFLLLRLHLLLSLGQLLGALLLEFVFFLLGLLRLLGNHLLSLLLHLLDLEGPVRGLLLGFQRVLRRLLLEVRSGLADDNQGGLLEPGHLELAQELLPRVLHQVAPDLHDDVVPGLKGGDGEQRLADAAVVELLHLEVALRLVVAGLVFIAPVLPNAALLGPVHDHAVAELGVRRVLLQEHVQPREGALVGQADREGDIVLAIRRGRIRRDLDVGLGGILHHVARERQRSERGRAEVHVHGRILEADVREQGLALQTLGQGLRLRDSLAILEKAHGVGVLALLVEVQQYCHNIVTAEPQAAHRALLVVEDGPIGVEADAVGGGTEDQGGASCREADPDDIFAHPVVVVVALHDGVGHMHELQNLHLEHIPALANTDAGSRACHQVLNTTLVQRHQDRSIGR
mmetsp:Transcript_90706/g.290761  ORF Transcript_90706/g.290761 Transcript_90706/m.290761 type:complete len:469 (+) Transcript_90706:1097-2503(+)